MHSRSSRDRRQSAAACSDLLTSSAAAWTEPRMLLHPRPGFYVMRLRRGAPLVPALMYQLCPMVIPQPTSVDGPNPDEWCRPLNRSPRFAALIDGTAVPVDRVWTARSLRPISPAEYAFRIGPLRRWARANPVMPEARPDRTVDLAALPPLFWGAIPWTSSRLPSCRPGSATTSRRSR
jgi:hypothetical protein